MSQEVPSVPVFSLVSPAVCNKSPALLLDARQPFSSDRCKRQDVQIILASIACTRNYDVPHPAVLLPLEADPNPAPPARPPLPASRAAPAKACGTCTRRLRAPRDVGSKEDGQKQGQGQGQEGPPDEELKQQRQVQEEGLHAHTVLPVRRRPPAPAVLRVLRRAAQGPQVQVGQGPEEQVHGRLANEANRLGRLRRRQQGRNCHRPPVQLLLEV